MTAVLLALASAATFGAMTVAIRVGLRDGGAAGAAALATLLPAFGLALRGGGSCATTCTGAWRFLLAGLLAPGVSQLLFTLGGARGRRLADVGRSRRGAAVRPRDRLRRSSASPSSRCSSWAASRSSPAACALAAERDRPGHLRLRGIVFALCAAALFAVRDNIVRALHAHGSPETAAAATLLAGIVVASAYTRRAPTQGELRRLAPAGLLFGLSYLCLFEAYFHGRVSVVSPLVATESLWGVGLAAVVFRAPRGSADGSPLGALLVVVGGVLIGVAQ